LLAVFSPATPLQLEVVQKVEPQGSRNKAALLGKPAVAPGVEFGGFAAV
jgi:hypothetical protein